MLFCHDAIMDTPLKIYDDAPCRAAARYAIMIRYETSSQRIMIRRASLLLLPYFSLALCDMRYAADAIVYAAAPPFSPCLSPARETYHCWHDYALLLRHIELLMIDAAAMLLLRDMP